MEINQFFTKKRIIEYGLILIFSIGLIVGVLLLKEKKVFKSNADTDPITFKDSQGNPLSAENGVPVTNSMNIKVELRAPQL